MKRITSNIAVLVLLAASVWLTSCSDRNNTSDSDQTNNDTSLTDTRRNTTDTVNYLTNDSGNQSQNTIDMDPPANSRY